MRRVTAALACAACAACALTFAGAASSGSTSSRPIFGVADDTGKYAEDRGAAFFSDLADLGMSENRMSVTWDPSRPTTIPDQAFLDRTVPGAFGRGIQIELAIFPAKARALVDTPNGIQLFAQYAALVARRYPEVRRIVCLNEGNQTRFQQPQFDGSGKGVAGAIQEAAMAACYDALKAVNPNIDVIGFGFSPRGGDDPDAPSNVSHSPLMFLKEIGDAYRASGRTRPIADDVAIHCYPRANTDSPSVGFDWPNVGCANLDRFKQAWWDAFHGTAQPVFAEDGDGFGAHVRFVVDEAGYQATIPTDKANLYSGSENVPTIDDATQGRFYAQLIAQMMCDPDIALLNIFHLVDERSLTGWQSGLEYADGTHRASYALVKAALASTTCPGSVHRWHHATAVSGARVSFLRNGRYVSIAAAEGFAYIVTVSRGGRVLSSAAGTPAQGTTAVVAIPRLAHGSYRVRVKLTAITNSERTTALFRILKRR
jgi:nucleoside 2-deoxyribosyltransferase